MNSFNVVPLFAVPFYHSQINVDNDIKNSLKSLDFERLPINNGFISREKYVLEHEKFFVLKNEILKHIENFTRKVLSVDDYVDFYITNSRVMKHIEDDWSHRHDHRNSLLSGILYLETDDQSGTLRVHKNFQTVFPGNLDPKFNDYNPFNSSDCNFVPKNNDIFIFPSHIEHEVTKSSSKNNRYCLAFNVYAKGVFGNNRDISIETLQLN